MGAICPPLTDENAIYEVTSTTLHLLRMKGLYGGLNHKDPHEHVRNFIDVCSPLSLKNLSQESMWLRLFPLSLTGLASKWLVELPKNSITSWDELITTFNTRFFPPSRMMKLRDNIQCFKRLEGEPIHETWLRFKKLLLQCPTHRFPNDLVLQYFYRSLDSVNKRLADQLVREGIMLQSFEVASFLLYDMTKIIQAWYTQTQEDQVLPFCFRMTQEQLNKERERDENIKKMLAQMGLLQEHVLENVKKTKGTSGMFRVEEGSSSGYSKMGENQGWNSKICEEGFHPRYLQRGGNQAQLEPNMTRENGDRGLAMVTRSGNVAVGNVKGNDKAQIHEVDKGIEEDETPIQQSVAKELQAYVPKSPPMSKVEQPLPKVTPPFPQCLKNKNEDERFKKLLLVFKTLSINLPLVEALLEMPGYAKFMKELVNKKRSLDFETI
ncbi:hypothetical protein R3W88_033331 [Solanum pinnatisectum]|uniref:Retrotransposon gag domain-containing protein n=1 Tax=Solanum pinnatisectum TaxID=50273 RepID=A0AAV9K1M1_9SOLN|nr:hypothetical protein R3W88_033331 [Solanum pinnatisectum]